VKAKALPGEAASIQGLHFPDRTSLEDHISVNERSPNGIAAQGDFGSVHPSRKRFATIDGHEGMRYACCALMMRKPRLQ
jgi:hypothetical protein